MNKERRRQIDKALRMIGEGVVILQDVALDEFMAIENTPESLQDTERFHDAEAYLDKLNDAIEAIQDATNELEEGV